MTGAGTNNLFTGPRKRKHLKIIYDKCSFIKGKHNRNYIHLNSAQALISELVQKVESSGAVCLSKQEGFKSGLKNSD